MHDIQFVSDAWEEYLYWQSQDKKTLKRVNLLLKDIQREPFSGIGKPEPLQNSKNWSRRIDDKHRLVYEFNDGIITIKQCYGHYED